MEQVSDARMVAGRVADPLMLDVLRGLTLPASLRDAVLEVMRQRIAQPVNAQAGMVAQLQGRLARLRDLYELGDMDCAESGKRRVLVRQIVEAVWLKKTPPTRFTITAIKPAASYMLLLPTIVSESSVVISTGLVPGLVTLSPA